MALLSQHPCTTPGCRNLVRGSAKCPEHSRQYESERAKRDDQAREYRYNSAEWKRARSMALARNPHCACGAKATLVHHIHPVRVAPELLFSDLNLESTCAPCHQRKHAAMKAKRGG